MGANEQGVGSFLKQVGQGRSLWGGGFNLKPKEWSEAGHVDEPDRKSCEKT